jgi:hypothetical protein
LLDVVEYLILSLSGHEMGQPFSSREVDKTGNKRQLSRGVYLKRIHHNISISGIREAYYKYYYPEAMFA